MKRITISASHDSVASPQDIYPLLRDSSTYPVWSMVGAYEMERAGEKEPHDLGEIRILKTWPFTAREEMIEFESNRCVGYKLLSGFPMRDYRARTTLEPLPGGGTRITWQSSFYPKYFGTGWFWRSFMLQVLRRFVRDLAHAGEVRA
jgi:hypothetical protein